jgi:hypothetical protein
MNTIRTIKATGAVLAAVFAVSALAATAAQAGTFTAAAYPATITGQNVGGAHVFETELGAMNCNVLLHGEMAAASEELTLTPTYNCGIAGIPVDVHMNGCDYIFHAGETLGQDEVAGSMDIFCPTEEAIDFEITGMVTCHLTVGPQSGLEALTYTDRTMAKDVDADMSLVGIEYELDEGCPVVGVFANGTYEGTTTLKSDNEGVDAFTVD